MKTDKILIIGHFGGNNNFLDGQTVKTKILYDELRTNTDWKINIVDTYLKQKKPIRLLLKSIFSLVTHRKVIVLLSGNGMKFYFPLLYFFSRFFKTKVYHDVIGGNLDSYVTDNKKFVKYLNSFTINWVETKRLKKRLLDQNINNCMVLPNFKRLNCINKNEIKDYKSDIFKFCTFSRVMKEKGIEEAIKAVQEINRKATKIICILDIYGVIDEGYKEKFDELLSDAGEAINYCGVVSYSRSVETIKEYYALLFPTYWHGEGFPGTIVDAFSAGLPVVASDWNSNSEIVSHFENGILYPREGVEDLEKSLVWMMHNKQQVVEMKKKCVETAEKYMPDQYIELIINHIKK